ncbi:hypothetical protein [Chryseobacterium sp. 2VB]|uniref:hypothetical protein n=1 Tax=Chryseobacterium sp. 2VB TaxID=2502204 RepID=UPI0010F83E6C|nr:hypothetical protein [Chryseobacterium sp. 2VB]
MKDETVGKEIIDENADRFISNMYGLPSQYHKDGTFPVFLLKKAGKTDFFKEQCESVIEIDGLNSVENCRKDYFTLVNKEGFHINENTKYLSFDLTNFSKESSAKKVQIIEDEPVIKSNAYVQLKFSNIYIDHSINKAFIVLEENVFTKGRYGGKVDIYFFTKKKDKWIFDKKLMLLTA